MDYPSTSAQAHVDPVGGVPTNRYFRMLYENQGATAGEKSLKDPTIWGHWYFSDFEDAVAYITSSLRYNALMQTMWNVSVRNSAG